MAKPKDHPQLSLSSAHNADRAAGIADDHWSRRFFERIYCSFNDGDFAELYEEGGRYPISPGLLASITLLQHMFKVSDREAVENTIMRRDWRIALGRDDAWKGFDASVLCNFRKRLVEAGCQRMIFDHVLGQIEQCGLLRGRRRVRVDATQLVANVARLSRLDMLKETLRVAVCELWNNYRSLQERPELVRLYDEYGEEVWLGRGSEGEERLKHIGRDGFLLLDLFEEVEEPRPRTVECRELLAQVLRENFERLEDGDARPLEGDELVVGRVATPHEPDAKMGNKAGKRWLGDKMHVVETADPDRTNFIIDLLTRPPTEPDVKTVREIVERLYFRMPDVDTLLADAGYSSARAAAEAAALGVDLVSPPLGNTSKQKIFPPEAFDLDFENKTATCPAGQTTDKWYVRGRHLHIRFAAALCAECPLRARCTTGKSGRTLTISRNYEQLLQDRAREKTQAFAELYRLRGGVEATISELVHRCGGRVSRYRGGAKRYLHAILVVTALDVRRFLHCDLDVDVLGPAPMAATATLNACFCSLWRILAPTRAEVCCAAA